MEINKDPNQRQLLWFGILLGPFVALLGGVFQYRWGTGPAAAVWIVGGLLTLAYLSVRRLRKKIFLGWMYAVYPIGWTVSHAVLALVFFGLLLPIGRLMRWRGHDPLDRRSPSRDSYWAHRNSKSGVERYFKQF